MRLENPALQSLFWETTTKSNESWSFKRGGLSREVGMVMGECISASKCRSLLRGGLSQEGSLNRTACWYIEDVENRFAPRRKDRTFRLRIARCLPQARCLCSERHQSVPRAGMFTRVVLGSVPRWKRTGPASLVPTQAKCRVIASARFWRWLESTRGRRCLQPFFTQDGGSRSVDGDSVY